MVRAIAVLLLALAALAAAGCVSDTYTVRSTDIPEGEIEKPAPRVPTDDDPLPLFASAQGFESGDTIILVSGKPVRLIGCEAPKPGEAYSQTARDTLQSIVRSQVFRLVYASGTKYTDPVWHANVLVPSLSDVKLAEGVVSPRGRFANSVNCLLLANGLVRARGIEALQFARVNDDGKLDPLDEAANQAVRDLFTHSANIARQNSRGLFSGQKEP